MTPPSPPDINLLSVSGYVICIMTSGIYKLCYLNSVRIVKNQRMQFLLGVNALADATLLT